jgi:REP element-mobilizing transposase RayT
MSDIIERLSRNFKLRDSELLLANGNDNHIHILGKFRDYQSFSRIVGWSKGECSYWINHKYPTLEFYWQKGFWHERIPEEQLEEVKTYIQDQITIHEQLTFMEEITKFRKAQN